MSTTGMSRLRSLEALKKDPITELAVLVDPA